LERRDQDGTTVVGVSGEVDLASSPDLTACLDQVDGVVVVDLSDVTFLDSSGMGALVAARKRLQADGGDLTVRAPRDNVRGALEATGLGVLIDDER
jgi:stage II sporulation protein AA (anti-sigma F factor antagonist)